MKTTIVNGKEIPLIEPAEVTTIIKNKKTGEIYETDEEWQAKSIAEEDIQKDVTVVMPPLDLFSKTK
jgi:membrane-bound ClpP family serine protease|tara:strand:+ start:112 stop:312 length:201 start_codon:yes stop_codon:yes gene_type:complete